ncbi:MAG: NAD(P)H-binding protein [Sandaracinaceae bacterium]|nr:NAD(P)H-binding protein [Sandaracinaceae bacterium]
MASEMASEMANETTASEASANEAGRETHVIFGAGQIGPLLAGELIARGKRVRIVRRGAPSTTAPGLEWMRGDVRDEAFAREAARGAAVVYNCVNPSDYSTWARELRPLFRGVMRAARSAGARLVVLDNLYMYGPTKGEPMRESTPMRPSALKSNLRAQLATELFEAHDKGLLTATSGRASDYFGKGTSEMSLLGAPALAKLAAGKSLDVAGDPDLVHAFSYAPDVAKGLAILGTSEESWGRPWHLPVSWQGTTRELVALHARALGARAKLRVAPKWLLEIAGVFVPTAGALVEMLYQWDAPFVVDDSAFRARFGVEATPPEQAVRETVETFRARLAA